MPCQVAVAWDDELLGYDFGGGHPLNPVRVELTMALARSLGVLDLPQVRFVAAQPATESELSLVHTLDYQVAVRQAGATLSPDPRHGLGTSDNPVFPHMHEASALVAGATLAAARSVLAGDVEHAVNVAGGLHHAMAGHASGFCVYNDPAIAIRWLLDAGVGRIAYVDVDAHHGDGVQAAFWDEPRVLTVSLHETGRTLFPGTGFPDETGGPQAAGTAVNVALPAGTGDAGWLRALHAVVPPLLQRFQPDLLLSQHGCDAHALDPLTHLMVSVDGQRAAAAMLHHLAHEYAGGRWLAVGGGGYELVRVVPRTWTHLLAETAGSPLDPGTATPQEWREFVARRTGAVPPADMTDGRTADYVPWEGGDPGDPVDAAIAATCSAVFPLHRLPLL